MRLHRPFAAALVIACVACSATAALAGPWSLAPGEYYTELSGSTFATSSYYNDDSKRADLGHTAGLRQFDSYTELGWKKRLSAQLSLPFRTVTTAADAGASNSRSGLGDFGFGLRYSLADGATGSSVQLGWTAPTGYNRKLADALGAGVQTLSATFNLGKAFGKTGFWQAGAGYAYDYLSIGSRKSGTLSPALPTAPVTADRNWSDHFTLNAAAAKWFGKLLVAGLYDAQLPMSTGRGYDVAVHRAGTRFAYAADPRIDVFGGSWHTPGGRNTPHYDQFYAGITFKATKLGRQQGFLGTSK